MKNYKIEHLQSEEKEAIEKLRCRLKNDVTPEIYDDNVTLYRFLKARDFNLDKAESMLKKHLEWRKANRVDNILTEYTIPEVIKKYGAPSFVGYDKEGCIVRYFPSGNMDEKGIYKSVATHDLMQSILHVMETDSKLLEHQSEKLGKAVYQWVYVYNLEKLTLAKATNRQTTELLLESVHLNQDNYPERVKKLIIINAPIYFQVVFSIIKAVMANELLNKIHIYGADGWKEELLNIIDADVLPAFLGGNRTDPDGNPLCSSFIYHGSMVPKSCYLIKKCSLSEDVRANSLLVYPLSKVDVPFNVQEKETVIEWEYESKKGDIGFGLFYRENCDENSKMLEILPVQKIDTTNGSETGIFKCETPGIYVLVFDNSYSWLKPKEVFYKIFLVKLNGEKIPIVK